MSSRPLTLARAVCLLRLPYREEAVYRVLDKHGESGRSLLEWAEIETEFSGITGEVYRVDGDRVLDPAGAVVVELVRGRAWAFFRNAPPYTYELHANDPPAWLAWATQGKAA